MTKNSSQMNLFILLPLSLAVSISMKTINVSVDVFVEISQPTRSERQSIDTYQQKLLKEEQYNNPVSVNH